MKHALIDLTQVENVEEKSHFLRPEFPLNNERRQQLIEEHFRSIMETLGLDLSDSNLKDTPRRVAKMFVKEIFRGLDPAEAPEITLFENTAGSREMVVVRDISVFSFCEHHFLPFTGKAHIAYFPGKFLAGLSKLNRLVDYYARRPQLQERLTHEIAAALKSALHTGDVAIMIEAKHMCVSLRGVRDESSDTRTVSFSGKFLDKAVRQEFLELTR
jgi:GTP cyclohydrolase IA